MREITQLIWKIRRRKSDPTCLFLSCAFIGFEIIWTHAVSSSFQFFKNRISFGSKSSKLRYKNNKEISEANKKTSERVKNDEIPHFP